MRKLRGSRLTRRSSEAALDRSGPSGSAHLDQVLTAATAPAAGQELARESDAVAMFRGTQLGPVPAGRPTLLQSTRSRLVAARFLVAGATAALLASGGVALAASTGHLPNPFAHSGRSSTGPGHSAHPTAGQTGGPTGGPTEPSDSGAPDASASPTPSYRGLCTAFQAGGTANAGKALANPAFTALVTKAGGAGNVAAYCVTLIGAPGSHPTGKPTALPSQAGGHPTGRPTSLPTQANGHPAEPTHPPRPTALPTQANRHGH